MTKPTGRSGRSGPTPRPPLRVRPARLEDLAAMAEIYNQGIRERVATFETRERSAEDLRPWLDDPKRPVLVAQGAGSGDSDEPRTRATAAAGEAEPGAAAGGSVLGWIAASAYRPRECYAGVAEFSVYVDRAARGRAVGHALVEAFLPACTEAGLWKVLSRVFPENRASLRLLAAHGFREVGLYRRHARLDGAWRDVVIIERLLGPAADEGERARSEPSGRAGQRPEDA